MIDKSQDIQKADIEALLSSTSIGAVVSRYVQWDKARKGWACCPFHQEKSASFHVRHRVDGKAGGRYKCFGCGESGDVISFVMKMEGVSFLEAYRRLKGDLKPTKRAHVRQPKKAIEPGFDKRSAAKAIWDGSVPIVGTLAETYLRARGVGGDLSETRLRFHAAAPVKGYSPDRSDTLPAMVAAIRKPSGEFIGAHVTYLAADGRSKADIKPARKVYGNQDGGLIFLALIAERMVIGEGIESALTASEITGRPAVAAVCSSNMAKLPPIEGVRDWLVAYDRDANQTGFKAGKAFAERALAAGISARALPPPTDVKDWNDAAQRRL